jgi:hypothetical protein
MAEAVGVEERRLPSEKSPMNRGCLQASSSEAKADHLQLSRAQM